MSPIESLHQTYCKQTGIDLVLTMERIYTWEAFIARKFTETDLFFVCRRLRFQIDLGKRSIHCLNFRRLIGDPEHFEELLREFRALHRKPYYTGDKASVLKATGRETEPKQPDAQSSRTIIERLKMAGQLRDFRKKL